MKIYALFAMLLLACPLALAQAESPTTQPDLVYVHLTKPNTAISAQPLTTAVAAELRTGENEVAASYMSQNVPGMRVVLGDNRSEIYIQIDAKYASSLGDELKWLSKIGALSDIDEQDISKISTLAQTSREISHSPSGWVSPQTTAATAPSPLASKIWEEHAQASAGEAAPTTSTSQEPPTQPGQPSLPSPAPTTGAASQPSEEESQKTEAESAAQKTTADGAAKMPATDAAAQNAAKGTQAQRTECGVDSRQECIPPQNIFDFSSILAPMLTAAAVLLAIIVAVIFRSPSSEQIETHRILSSPTRMDILNELSTNEKIPTDLSSRLKKSKATIIEHLERMQEAGFVEKVQTPGKKFVYYRITSKGKTALLRSAA